MGEVGGGDEVFGADDADEFGAGDADATVGGAAGDFGDDGVDGSEIREGEVKGDLAELAGGEGESEGADAEEAGVAIAAGGADIAGDLFGQGRVREVEVDVEGDEEVAPAHDGDAELRVGAFRAEVGIEATLGEGAEAAFAEGGEIGFVAALLGFFVEEDWDFVGGGDAGGGDVNPLVDFGGGGDGVFGVDEGEDGEDVEAADAGVDAGVPIEVNGGEDEVGEVEEGVLEGFGGAGKGGDGTVVVDVGFGVVEGEVGVGQESVADFGKEPGVATE